MPRILGIDRVNLGPSQLGGLIPVGTVIPIMSHIAGSGAYSLPSTGVVQHGFMLADGAAIPASQALSGNTPTLTDNRFIMGAATAGTTGGVNSVTPSGTVAAPTFTGSSVAMSSWAAGGTYTPSGSVSGSFNNNAVQANNHSHGSGIAISPSFDSGSFYGSTGAGVATTGYQFTGLATGDSPTSGTFARVQTETAAITFPSATISLTSTGFGGSSVTISSTFFSGSSYTPAGSNSAPAFTGVSQENRPVYLAARYLIRVN